MMRVLAIAGAVAATSMVLFSMVNPVPLSLKTIIDVPIEHKSNRFDYESVDPITRRLFIADLAGSRVLVFDMATNRFLNAIEGVSHVHGVLAVPDRAMVYASATGSDEVFAIDEKTSEILWHAPVGHYPDGMAWAPGPAKLYVSNEHGDSIGVIDGSSHRLLKLVPTGGEVGNTQYDSADGLIYSNIQTLGEIIVIDPATDTEIGRIKVPGCAANHGLAIDPARQIAYVACEDNARMVTLSLKARKLIDSQAVGSGPDVLAYDLGLNRLYVAAEDGTLTMFDTSRAVPIKIGSGWIADNAHVVGADPVTHRVYLPLRDVGGVSALRVMSPE